MKTIRKRISAVLLSVYMVFGVVSTDYLTVQAFEWVVPSLSVGESLMWLMGLLGMTYTEGASAFKDVSPEYEQDFIDYANEHGLTYTQTSSWLNDVATGKLDQLSQVWTNFKEWLSSLSSSSVSGNYPDMINNTFHTNFTFSGANFNMADIDSFLATRYFNVNLDSYTYQFCFIDGSGAFITDKNYNGRVYVGASSYPITCYYTTVAITDSNSNVTLTENVLNDVSSFRFSSALGVDLGIYNLVNNLGANVQGNVFIFDEATDSDFDTYNPALIPDINFADSNTEDASIPGVIDLPWGNLGEDEDERDKTYDDLVGGLDLGQEIGDLWQALQDLMGVLAVDDSGVLQPNDGGENPPTLDDEVENNKVNGAFVLTGLQKVFPFCIPFDLYAFMNLLVAPPVAPVIEYPIYNPVTDTNEIITIDFSTWESVVILFRYIFDFLFIVGILLIARALIGGGDSA